MNINSQDYVLNPNTNRYIKRTSPLYKRLLKSGVIGKNDEIKKPDLVVETKKVKVISNVQELNKTEVDDVYKQLKHLREKYDPARRKITTRFPGQKPPTKSKNVPATKVFQSESPQTVTN